jgi:diadenosine tetraphosphate (Ap4A) HIT family hydrolase
MTIREEQFWLVEHAYPTTLPGWLVVVLKRHCEKLHELSRAEWLELADLQFQTVRSLNDLHHTEREFTCCFAETDGFKHIHFHAIPKPYNADSESVGTKVFHHLKIDHKNAISPDEVSRICGEMALQMKKYAGSET